MTLRARFRFQRHRPVRAKKTNESPKPHWISIIHQLGTPALTVIAVWYAVHGYNLSNKSLETAQQSMKVGQRAYLSLRSGELYFYPISKPTDFSSEGGLLDGILKVDIANLGNTPARIESLDLMLLEPSAWRLLPYNRDLSQKTFKAKYLGEVGPKASVKHELIFNILLSVKDWKEYHRSREMPERVPGSGWLRVRPSPPIIRIVGTLWFYDVFNELLSIQWCWTMQEQSRYPSICSADYHLREYKKRLQ